MPEDAYKVNGQCTRPRYPDGRKESIVSGPPGLIDGKRKVDDFPDCCVRILLDQPDQVKLKDLQ